MEKDKQCYGMNQPLKNLKIRILNEKKLIKQDKMKIMKMKMKMKVKV